MPASVPAFFCLKFLVSSARFTDAEDVRRPTAGHTKTYQDEKVLLRFAISAACWCKRLLLSATNCILFKFSSAIC